MGELFSASLMIIIGKKKKDSFEQLQEFSGEMIGLGEKIEEKLKEKKEAEQQITEKEGSISRLRTEVFRLKERLVDLTLELSGLEQKRQIIEDQEES